MQIYYLIYSVHLFYYNKKIDAERQRNKMSIPELMKKLGLSRATYFEWQKNDGNIAVKRLKAMAWLLHIPVGKLIEPLQQLNASGYKLFRDILNVIQESECSYGKRSGTNKTNKLKR